MNFAPSILNGEQGSVCGCAQIIKSSIYKWIPNLFKSIIKMVDQAQVLISVYCM